MDFFLDMNNSFFETEPSVKKLPRPIIMEIRFKSCPIKPAEPLINSVDHINRLKRLINNDICP